VASEDDRRFRYGRRGPARDPRVGAGQGQRAALEAAGWSPDAARLQVEMNRVFSDGSVAARATRTAASTTPTRFEDYAAADLAPAFAALAVAEQ
jgi:hypothetical protein